MEGKGGEGGNASIYAYNAREREKIARLLVSRRIFLLDHARFVSQSYVHLSHPLVFSRLVTEKEKRKKGRENYWSEREQSGLVGVHEEVAK